ncbi:glycoside hydrolase family 3 N-terminal domain-containing protein [Bifidobacterium sp.]|uniref:glycoside hydrolase family 3 N-terminal domain-containing protein n=1 Tax=Bifidobacterium sp. TaxID=41200 RepID=UPI0025C4BB30|nr:glycoside hydrolase family 3 N-terminal domain-containing protein [Bifidobacterium sp.]MCH4209941.1 glycoside hydrolase family 3 C-terminal domain-containing protein [Bifidobacterium sp.]MCI1225322.1 glycoside hydrolase family 3 C-terminal domain-containing protein [Bifidobacterium sp.]
MVTKGGYVSGRIAPNATTSREQFTYRDPQAPVGERIADLLGRMSVEEKVGQIMQLDAQNDLRSDILDKHVGSILHTSPERLAEAAALVRQTRLRIPLIVGEDCIHGYSFWPGATIFPSQLTMAGSWDPELIEQAARVTAVEASATGVHWTFSPVLCIARDLRWGRVDETFGEDPFLIGEFASAMVRGYQGDGLDDPTAILACAKHFAGYSETQGGRDASEADISHRKLRSWFLPPFERVAREGCRTFMLGYQTTDGVPITLNEWLLNDVLCGEWGYEGTLITDWDNVGRMVWEQHIQPDYEHAAAAAVKAGNDLIMSTPGFFEGALAAIRDGLIQERDLDGPVARVLRLKFELGLFENPRIPDRARIAADIGAPDHTALNLEIARRSLVLLRNDGTLPLTAPPLTGATSAASGRIAVVGPLADDENNQLGDWAGGSGQVNWITEEPAGTVVTALQGLRREVPDGWEVSYAKGADILRLVPDPAGAAFADGQPRPPIQRACEPDPALLDEAVRASKEADVTVAVVGDVIALTGEGRSTATLELFGAQNALLEALCQESRATGKPLIVVLMASKPLILPQCVRETASAIIWAGNPGMQGGRALAELLLGKIEPKGRLPISFARHAGQQPTYYNQIRGQHGDRYADLTQEPAFVFGEGLSYSAVEYGPCDLSVAPGDGDDALAGATVAREEEPSQVPIAAVEDTIRIRIQLTNTGTRPASETVQAYIHDKVTSVSWAGKELKGYSRVELEPGETRTAVIDIPVASCSLVDTHERRVVEPGEFEALVGHSSKDRDLRALPFVVR